MESSGRIELEREPVDPWIAMVLGREPVDPWIAMVLGRVLAEASAASSSQTVVHAEEVGTVLDFAGALVAAVSDVLAAAAALGVPGVASVVRK